MKQRRGLTTAGAVIGQSGWPKRIDRRWVLLPTENVLGTDDRGVPISAPVIEEFGSRLAGFPWVSELLVGGSLATGDYSPGTSDLDLVALVALFALVALVALVDSTVDVNRLSVLTALHRELDQGLGSGIRLGCVYANR